MYDKIYLKLLLFDLKGGIEMNFKDRGNKKWTAMMLIEHRDRLKELKASEKERKKPILDDQEKKVINYRLQQALQNNLSVEIKYYEDKRFKITNGRIDKVDINQKYILINNLKIPLDNLLEVKLE
ncbi:YolD-like protein [Halanaerobium congolense]|uniref:YolD-like protein n=3 Tax=Halanaerobiaceae TaxID=972 RepID=A0A1I0CIA3_9FIRM|nr:YolD-like family protein [Halanaerobium congolense]PTV94435.1 YolD-like protein [Halanaerobium saccharolyticum]PTX14821.1 YolD-like protein [Halanaerobium congolense]SDG20748.1 YolD-like protein [Halanaerobium congolense]SET19333.1 YolD-like protein [Halanaerobium congolense]SFP79084.1 YolD-like protein [Halanaerobium congolense]